MSWQFFGIAECVSTVLKKHSLLAAEFLGGLCAVKMGRKSPPYSTLIALRIHAGQTDSQFTFLIRCYPDDLIAL